MDISVAVESTFREEGGRIIAALIRISGSFDWAEEAMQEAFASALASWPEKGIPRNPGAWVMAAAHHKLIDHTRRERTRREKADPLRYESETVSLPDSLLLEERCGAFTDERHRRPWPPRFDGENAATASRCGAFTEERSKGG